MIRTINLHWISVVYEHFCFCFNFICSFYTLDELNVDISISSIFKNLKTKKNILIPKTAHNELMFLIWNYGVHLHLRLHNITTMKYSNESETKMKILLGEKVGVSEKFIH